MVSDCGKLYGGMGLPADICVVTTDKQGLAYISIDKGSWEARISFQEKRGEAVTDLNNINIKNSIFFRIGNDAPQM